MGVFFVYLHASEGYSFYLASARTVGLVKGIWSVISYFLLGTLLWGSGWRAVEELREQNTALYIEGIDPFAKHLNYDLSNLRTGSLYPEILRWGAQRNLAKDHTGGLFSKRLTLGLNDQARTSANFTPRLMPFGGPLRYAHGRDFTFNLEEPGNSFADANFIEYYQYAIPFYESTGEMEISYGEFGSITSSIETTLPVDNFQAAINGSWKEFGNYRDGDGTLLTESLDLENPKVKYIPEAAGRDIYRIREIEASGKYTFSSSQELVFNSRYTDAENVYFPELRMDAAYDRGSNLSAEYHVRNPSATVQKLSVRAFSSNAQQGLNDRWRVTKVRDPEIVPGLEDYSTRAESRSLSQGFDFRAIKDLSDSQIGFGMRRYWQEWQANTQTIDAPVREMLPDIDQSNFGAYLEAQKFLGNFMFSTSVRIDQLDTEVNGDIGFIKKYRPDIQRRIQDSALSASVRASYDLSDNTMVYMEVGHASRTPDPNEMYVQYEFERAPGNSILWLGNPDLESVKNTSFDLGFETKLKRLSLKVNGFYSRVQDMIYLEDMSQLVDSIDEPFFGTAMSYNNVDAVLWGGESTLQLKLTDSLRISGSFEFLEGRKTKLDGLSGDEDLAEMPPMMASVSVEYNNKLWYGRVEAHMAEAQLRVDESVSESTLDGYTVVNFILGYYITDNILWTIGVENITDRTYSTKNVNIRNPFTNYGVSNEPGRFFYMSLKWGF